MMNSFTRWLSQKRESGVLSLLLKIFAGIGAGAAFLLTFTVSDYYIFNRIAEYGFFFCLSQWAKKAGLILIILAVFFGCRRCADGAKYLLPLFVLLSCFLFKGFFTIEPEVAETDINGQIFKSVNAFFPVWLNVTLYFLENLCLLFCAALFFLRDGYTIKKEGALSIPLGMLLALPLNIFENFFDIDAFPKDSFWRFYNFTVWHLVAFSSSWALRSGSTIS